MTQPQASLLLVDTPSVNGTSPSLALPLYISMFPSLGASSAIGATSDAAASELASTPDAGGDGGGEGGRRGITLAAENACSFSPRNET
mmetsp:Transcript_27704/g.63817  ORF Transcript_27704/g.63817 Transcript_27704/m.63817 type:complete len:88 (+) Transcript_27704:169-432(+)